jgi:hypothetical protein
MNGLLQEAYWTIHITPESHCSYASFETNVRLNNYGPLVKAVLDIFRPKRYTMTLFADEQGLKQLKGGTAFPLLVAVPLLGAGPKPGVPTVLSADGSFEVAASAEGGGGSGGSGGSGSGNGSGSSGNGGATSPPANLPSIVVCPATLTAHWRAEATKFCGSDGLCVLEYGGSAQQRARLRSRVHEVELVVMSYETLRTDIDAPAQVGDQRTAAQSDCSLIAL